MNRRILAAIAATAMLLTALMPGAVMGRSPATTTRPLPDSIKSMKLDKTVKTPALKDKVHTSLKAAKGPQRIFVRLDAAPAASVASSGATAQKAQVRRVKAQQKAFTASVKRLDHKAVVLGQTQTATNVVALQVDSATIAKLAKNPNVVSIKPVVNYKLALSRDGAVHRRDDRPERRLQGCRRPRRDPRLRARLHPCRIRRGRDRGRLRGRLRDSTTTRATPPSTACSRRQRVKGGFDFVGESWPGDDGIEDPSIRTRSTSRATGPTSPTSSAARTASRPRSRSTR